MIVMGVESRPMQFAWRDREAIIGLDRIGAEATQFGAEITEPVALLGPDESDTADARRAAGKCRDRSDRRDQIR